MKKLNLGNITAGLETLKGLQEQNASVARSEQIRADLIDLAEKNSYAADDTEDSIRDLADQIEECGLLNPLGVIEHNGRYTLFRANAGIRRSPGTCTGKRSPAACLRVYPPDVRS